MEQKPSLRSVSANRSMILPQFGFRKLFNHLGIRQKIIYGYALAIGIAILGATAGNYLENFYQERAKERLAESQEIISLLNKLQGAVLQAHTQTPKLRPLLTEPTRLELEYSRLLEYVAAVNRLLNQIKASLERTENQDVLQEIEKDPTLKLSIQAYIDSIQDYSQRLEKIVREIDKPNLNINEIQSTSLLKVNLQSSQIDLKINKVSREMSVLIADIQDKEIKRTFQALEKAKKFGNLILVISLLSATAIAAILAIYTSWIIAYPIQATTKIAQRVTQESNFQLQAPILSQDEVGQLTTSLNQLIKRVADYTQELKQTQAQLIQTEKMSSLGQMVAGLAHEINNPVSFIYGNIQHTNDYIEDLLGLIHLYQSKYPHPEADIEDRIEAIDLDFLVADLPKTLTSMKLGAERIRQLVISLRNFSRLDEAEVKEVDLHEGLENTLLILNNRIDNKIMMVKNYGNLPLVKCSPAQLNQVFMNLINNAIDALLSCQDKPNKQIVIQTEASTPLQVKIKIRDNGHGIPEEIKNKIFDPFFTTKPVGSGTGLGLSICYQIIEKHGGEISFSSVKGEGTEFAIALPVHQPIGVRGEE